MSQKKKNFSYYKALVTGVVAFFIGFGGLYKLERKNYEEVVTEHQVPLMKAAFFGDSGEPSAERNQFVRLLDSLGPDRAFMLGDQGYPVGIRSVPEFEVHVVVPFMRDGRDLDLAGGNHDKYFWPNRDLLIELSRSGKYHSFHYDNYYSAGIWPNVCIFKADTAMYDTALPYPHDSFAKRLWGKVTGEETIVDRQEKHARMFFADKRCVGRPKIWAGHHPIYASDDSHGDREKEFGVGKDRFWKFYHSDIKGNVDWFINAHAHVTSRERCEHGTCHLTVGYSSKGNVCVRQTPSCYEQIGLAWWDGKTVDLVVGGL